jgi:hypothetical protein
MTAEKTDETTEVTDETTGATAAERGRGPRANEDKAVAANRTLAVIQHVDGRKRAAFAR